MHESQTRIHEETQDNVLNSDTIVLIDKLTPPLAQLDKLASVNHHTRQINKLCSLKGIESQDAKFGIVLCKLHPKIEDIVPKFFVTAKRQITLSQQPVLY